MLPSTALPLALKICQQFRAKTETASGEAIAMLTRPSVKLTCPCASGYISCTTAQMQRMSASRWSSSLHRMSSTVGTDTTDRLNIDDDQLCDPYCYRSQTQFIINVRCTYVSADPQFAIMCMLIHFKLVMSPHADKATKRKSYNWL